MYVTNATIKSNTRAGRMFRIYESSTLHLRYVRTRNSSCSYIIPSIIFSYLHATKLQKCLLIAASLE